SASTGQALASFSPSIKSVTLCPPTSTLLSVADFLGTDRRNSAVPGISLTLSLTGFGSSVRAGWARTRPAPPGRNTLRPIMERPLPSLDFAAVRQGVTCCRPPPRVGLFLRRQEFQPGLRHHRLAVVQHRCPDRARHVDGSAEILGKGNLE